LHSVLLAEEAEIGMISQWVNVLCAMEEDIRERLKRATTNIW
jgi:hypothetical protein